MDDDKDRALFAYLLSQGQLTPEQEQMLRQQESINTLRERSMEMPETRMMGRVAVAPSWAQALGNVAQGISAGYQQKKLDTRRGEMSDMQRQGLERLMGGMFPAKQQPQQSSYEAGLMDDGQMAMPLQTKQPGAKPFDMTEDELRRYFGG